MRTKWLMPWIVLAGGALSCVACTTKLPANATEQGRSCLLGVVPRSQVEQVQVWAPAAQRGDFLMNPACDTADTERLLNDIRRDTR